MCPNGGVASGRVCAFSRLIWKPLVHYNLWFILSLFHLPGVGVDGHQLSLVVGDTDAQGDAGVGQLWGADLGVHVRTTSGQAGDTHTFGQNRGDIGTNLRLVRSMWRC